MTDLSQPTLLPGTDTIAGLAERKKQWLAGLLLVMVTVAVYLPVVRCGYIWDDDYYVTNNATLRDVHGLVRIWTEPGAVPQYYPLVHTVFWVQYQLFGLAPLSYHLVNLAGHVLVCLLWWRLLRRLSIPGSYLAAMLFAVHPIEVESVVWVTELKNILSGVFYLLTAMVYLRFVQVDEQDMFNSSKPLRWRWYGIALLCFVCALLSKTVVCTLPAALVLVMWWKRRRFPWHDLALLVPLFVLGIAMGLHTASMEKNHVGAIGDDWAFTFWDRLLIAGRVLWFYAGQLIWPAKMVFFYDTWQVDPGQWWQWLFPVGFVLVVYALLRNRHVISGKPLVAVLFFAGTLFPALGFVNVFPMRFSFVADHFQYLAGMGILALFSGVFWHLLRGVPHLRTLLAIVIVLVLGIRTFCYIPVYTNQQTLWQHVIAHNRAPWMALNNLGIFYRENGQNDLAQSCFKQAIIHRPQEPNAYNNLALLYRDTQHYEQAGLLLEHALPIVQREVSLIATLARVRELQGQPDQAIRLLKCALNKQPGNADWWLNLGILQMHQQQWADAQDALQQSLKLAPQTSKAWHAWGQTLAALQQPQQVLACYQQAVAQLPEDASLHNQLALAAVKVDQPQLAIQSWLQATRLAPDEPDYALNLGAIHLKNKQWHEARKWLEKAKTLSPNRPAALRNLALCLLNDPQTQLPDWREAQALMLHLQSVASPLDFADQHLLATACEAAGDYAQAVEVLRSLIASIKQSPSLNQALLTQLSASLQRCQKAITSP